MCMLFQIYNCHLFPPSWAPQARSEAWEVYPLELYPLDDPPRPSRPKAGLGLVIIIMMIMIMIMIRMIMSQVKIMDGGIESKKEKITP